MAGDRSSATFSRGEPITVRITSPVTVTIENPPPLPPPPTFIKRAFNRADPIGSADHLAMDAGGISQRTATSWSTGSPSISSTPSGIRCSRASSRARSPRRCRPGRRKSLNRSTPSWPTSSGCWCPASRTGTTRASSPTSPSPAARRACSPISCRPRSISRRCCGARRRRRPSSKQSRSRGSAG